MDTKTEGSTAGLNQPVYKNFKWCEFSGYLEVYLETGYAFSSYQLKFGCRHQTEAEYHYNQTHITQEQEQCYLVWKGIFRIFLTPNAERGML